MRLHGNAKLVPSNRRLLVARVCEEHWKVADVAASFGISERTVYRWLARWRAGDVRLLDRSSAPKLVPRRTPRALEALIERLRRLRMTSTRIAAELEMAVSTVGAVLVRLGLNRSPAWSRRSHRTAMSVAGRANSCISTSKSSAASIGRAIE